MEFYDKNREMVATYSNNGWTMYTTNADDYMDDNSGGKNPREIR